MTQDEIRALVERLRAEADCRLTAATVAGGFQAAIELRGVDASQHDRARRINQDAADLLTEAADALLLLASGQSRHADRHRAALHQILDLGTCAHGKKSGARLFQEAINLAMAAVDKDDEQHSDEMRTCTCCEDDPDPGCIDHGDGSTWDVPPADESVPDGWLPDGSWQP